jgi:hypothetical protein
LASTAIGLQSSSEFESNQGVQFHENYTFCRTSGGALDGIHVGAAGARRRFWHDNHLHGWHDLYFHRKRHVQRSRRRAKGRRHSNGHCRGACRSSYAGCRSSYAGCRSEGASPRSSGDIGRSGDDSGCHQVIDGFEIGSHRRSQQYRSDRSDCQV